MSANNFLDWVKSIITELGKIGGWLQTPIVKLGSLDVTPLGLVTVGGLLAFVVVAIVKWVVN